MPEFSLSIPTNVYRYSLSLFSDNPARSSANAAWFSAWIALAALIATATAAIFAGLAFRKQAKQVEILESDRHRELASNFGAWIHSEIELLKFEVHYLNAGVQPVYDVLLRLQVDGEPPNPIALGSVGPMNNPKVSHLATSALKRMASNAAQRNPTTGNNSIDEFRIATYGLASVELEFTDANGQRWLRKGNGELTASSIIKTALRKQQDPSRAAMESTTNFLPRKTSTPQ